MKIGAPRSLRRSLSLAVMGILIALVAACTGRGGGQLPPSAGFTGSASFGFSFSCESGQLKIQLSYTDHGSNPIGAPFSIHGIVDQVDPVLESATCIDHNPPPPPENQLIFLGRYYLTSSPPAGFPTADCPTQATDTNSLCRFEVIVQDNDRNLAPSPGDFFSIKLSNGTALTSEFDPLTVFYARAGCLDSGNITVD
jgi:hypothetical protein